MIETVTVHAFMLPNEDRSLLVLDVPHVPGGRDLTPQGFTQSHLKLAVRLADREAVTCVRSYGRPVVSLVGRLSFDEPEGDERVEFTEAAAWIEWRQLGSFDKVRGRVVLRRELS